MSVTSCIKSIGGTQTLFIDGKPYPGVAYITYLRDKARYRDFAEAGYRLFSTALFFGSNKLNSNSGLDVFSEGIYDSDEPDFSGFDRDLEHLFSVCPDAYVFPRVNVNPSAMWEADHPEELCDRGSPATPEVRRSCLASDVWAKRAKDGLKGLVKHIESSPYRDRIIGYQLAGGNTEEWIPYDNGGFSGERSREAFRLSGRPDTEEEYYSFLADTVADRIIELSKYVKDLTGGRLIVGSFYGYTFELCFRHGAHQALGRLLRSPYVDFLCSPLSYAYTRPMGIEHAYMVPIDSIRLHGKLYFSENDTRTHLSEALCDLPNYLLPIWFGHPKPDTLEVLKMHYAKSLLHGHACWWFDMWGGWYDDADYMSFMRRAREITEESAGLDSGSVSEVALFVDERAYSLVSDESGGRKFVHEARRELGLMGAPYDKYLAEDFDAVAEKYRAFILLEPAITERSLHIEAYAREHGIPIFKIERGTPAVTVDMLRQFLSESGVHLYTDTEAVIFASKSYVFLHTARDGRIRLTLPDRCKLTEVFTGEKITDEITARRGPSFLLRRG